MSVQRESRQESYDVVVVGSGMGGLSAATALAFLGKRVLVVERHDRPGGYAHSFQRRRYRFDSAAHVTSGCEPLGFGEGALIDHLLRVYGVRDRCSFIRLNPFYTAVFPDFRIDVPTGTQEFIEAHARHFPREEKGLRKFLRLCIRVNREMKVLPADSSSYDALNLPERAPLLHEYRDATAADVLDRYVSDARLKAILTALWTYQGLPPRRLAFVRWAPMLMSFIHTGVYYVEGTMQNLVNAFVTALERRDGELLLRTAVRRILVKDGRVSGVMLENGQRIAAPVVISNADALQTFQELVGPEHLSSAFLDQLRLLRPSISAVTIYMATDLDLARIDGIGHEMFVFDSWDHEDAYRRSIAGQPSAVGLGIPTLIDPSVAPPGEHLITLWALIPYDAVQSWRREKDRYVQGLLDRAETVVPGLRERITFSEGASPRTMERFTLNATGAIYGWEPSPEQAGANRLRRRTPVDGLYLAGHWTQPGAAIISVIVSGLQTAQLVTGHDDMVSFMQTLEHAGVGDGST